MASAQTSSQFGFIGNIFNFLLDYFGLYQLSEEITILCTGKWRENDEKRKKLEELINNKVTRLSQEDEGKKQAQCAHQLMCQQELLQITNKSDSDEDEDLFLYLGAGRGSTQFTITNIEGEVKDVVNLETGYPKSGKPNIELLKEAAKKIYLDYGKRIKFILGFDSLFHVLKKKCPVVPDSGDLPEEVKTTGEDFSELGYLTDLYSDVPMLVVRNFRMKNGTMRKITFATGKKLIIDIGTGNANLVDPTTGTQIKTVELSNDWMTNEESLKLVANGIKELMVVARTHTTTITTTPTPTNV